MTSPHNVACCVKALIVVSTSNKAAANANSFCGAETTQQSKTLMKLESSDTVNGSIRPLHRFLIG